MTSKRFIRISFPIIFLIALYFLGPAPSRPVYSPTMPSAPSDPTQLDQFVADQEGQHKVKPNNEARIVWNDSTKSKTEYAIVYLHGFTASQMEGDPIHKRFAKAFGANLYLSRLADHGVDTTETMLLFTADRLWESAKQALVIGKQLGDKVILVSTSTGGTVALKLAADYPQDVYALINLSPNCALRDGAAFILNNPWGLYIARGVLGGKYRVTDADELGAQYWNKSIRIEALTELEELLETTMTKETFQRVKQPSLTLYYYKNEQEQDDQVKVSAMLTMNEQLGTAAESKEAIAFPNAGAHVIGSSLRSGDVEGVYNAMEKFAVEKIGMTKVQ